MRLLLVHRESRESRMMDDAVLNYNCPREKDEGHLNLYFSIFLLFF